MYPSKPLLISSGVASVRWLEAKFGRSGRMSATITCPPGSYIMHQRALGPRGESDRSQLARLNFPRHELPCAKEPLLDRARGRPVRPERRQGGDRLRSGGCERHASLMVICLTIDWMQ